MLNFIIRLFRPELTDILKVFDKAHAKLDTFIARSSKKAVAAQNAADYHSANVNTAAIIKGNLTDLTSTADAVTKK